MFLRNAQHKSLVSWANAGDERTRKMCVCARASRCGVYTGRRVHGSCCCLDAKLPDSATSAKKGTRLNMKSEPTSWFWQRWISRLRMLFPVAIKAWIRCCRSLPLVGTAFTTSCDNHRCAVVWCLWDFELGRISFPHLQISVRSNTWCRHDGHWIQNFFNSFSSTLPISKIARLDSLLNTISSSAWSSRIQILFEPIFTPSISWGHPFPKIRTSLIRIEALGSTRKSHLRGCPNKNPRGSRFCERWDLCWSATLPWKHRRVYLGQET